MPSCELLSKNDIMLKEINKGKGNLVVCTYYIHTYTCKRKEAFFHMTKAIHKKTYSKLIFLTIYLKIVRLHTPLQHFSATLFSF